MHPVWRRRFLSVIPYYLFINAISLFIALSLEGGDVVQVVRGILADAPFVRSRIMAPFFFLFGLIFPLMTCVMLVKFIAGRMDEDEDVFRAESVFKSPVISAYVCLVAAAVLAGSYSYTPLLRAFDYQRCPYIENHRGFTPRHRVTTVTWVKQGGETHCPPPQVNRYRLHLD